MTEGLQALTEKEKETLRLVLQGYDAKSMARLLDLSVHTINERLRHARRKLAVTSSREAARILIEVEGTAPDSLGYKPIGADPALVDVSAGLQYRPWMPRSWMIGGTLVMTFIIAAVAIAAFSQLSAPALGDARSVTAVAAADAEMEEAAREWLVLVDEDRWQASYDATGQIFRELNTQKAWEDASLQARVPLGAATNREIIGAELVPTPPAGHAIVRFRTDFAARPAAVETVTLSREEGELKVVAYLVG